MPVVHIATLAVRPHLHSKLHMHEDTASESLQYWMIFEVAQIILEIYSHLANHLLSVIFVAQLQSMLFSALLTDSAVVKT